jgi:hypothetical protein
MLSQREIDHSVGKRDQSALLKFLNDFIVQELAELDRQEQQLRGKISQAEASLMPKLENQKRRAVIETSLRELQAQLENQKKLTALLPRWQQIVRERDFFSRLFTECEDMMTGLHAQVEKISLENAKVPEQLADCPEVEVIKEAVTLAENAASDLRQNMLTTLESFKAAVWRENSTLSQLYDVRWKPIFTQVELEFQVAQKEAEKNGVVASDIINIPQQIIGLETEVAALNADLINIQNLENARQTAIGELRGIWLKQTAARAKKATELMSKLRPYPDAKPYVEIEVYHQGQFEELVHELVSRIHDRRSINEEDIRGILLHVRTHSPENARPLLQHFIDEVRKGDASELIKAGLDYKERKKEALDKAFQEPVLRELETKRIRDSVIYRVFRPDGTLAGPIDKVSAGQQGTAILNLLLAAGNEPLIIDTPEEGLDNEGVYAELVPLFRREKESRQIIVVTHNANLPVNADAEGIMALEASGYAGNVELGTIVTQVGQVLTAPEIDRISDLVRWPDWEKRIHNYLEVSKHWPPGTVATAVGEIGRIRSAEGRIKLVAMSTTEVKPAVGALDAGAVKRAVQDIMEGSEAAFRKRREKYGF